MEGVDVGWITILVGGVIIALGAAVRFGGVLELLAGYDPAKVDDKAGLQRFAGTGVLTIGVLVTAAGTAEVTGLGTAAVVALWAVVIIVLAGLAVGAQRFTTRKDE